MRRVKQIMGTAVSIDIPAAKSAKPFNAAFKLLRHIDRRFSTYKDNSELSRYRRGELKNPKLSAQMQQIMQACAKAEAWTDGYFSASFGGQFDPTGYVKGWAIAQAANAIKAQGWDSFCVGIGGDIQAQGDRTWLVGIQDPANKAKILRTVEIKNAAVATSGNYERGEHIINPKTGKAARYWASVTVIGPDIIKADVLATAAFAAGPAAKQLLAKHKIYEAVLVKA